MGRRQRSEAVIFTKQQLIEAAREGNKIGFNRQLDPAAIEKNVADNEEFSVVFSMLHEYIKGERAEPHVRCIMDRGGIIDITMERYRSMDGKDADA